ncbi:MAG: ATP-dependent helicase HrpB [Negativicutes bacterium]|nr:ATP-dependent helicase HrpB [Negativicutes bacterium]
MTTLPIFNVLPELKQALAAGANAVLVAAPGAGKTTQTPLALLNEPWLAGTRILMLEPRRLAARAAARYMSSQLGEEPGETVGYRVRLETRVSSRTRIEVITEGILTRMLQSDPTLEGVGAVIFDEFHERSLHADLGLALCLDIQRLLRPDLRLLVMSATLEAEPVAKLMGGAPVIVSEGRLFPVETRYLDNPVSDRIATVPGIIREALATTEGDILVFLPGVGEIRRVERILSQAAWLEEVRIALLYGNLPPAAQDAAITPDAGGRRKVVLATSIAETSLTVEGVRTVIDCGLMRRPRFSPRTGMTRLETVDVSKASAEQRRGRAGRLGPGTCFRLWTKQEDARLNPRNSPEIMEADLAALALELAVWGAEDPYRLNWLDAPPAGAFAQARELLVSLGALTAGGKVTAHGQAIAAAGLHPRLAHMILTAKLLGQGSLACNIAALLSERDVLRRGNEPPDIDLRRRLEALYFSERDIDPAIRRRITAEIRQIRRQFGIAARDGDIDCTGIVLAFAYPDRIAQRRSDGRYLMANGRGAAAPVGQPLAAAEYLAIAEIDDQGTDGRILLAAPIAENQLRQYFAAEITQEDSIVWDKAAQAVRGRRRERLGALIIRDSVLPDPNPGMMLKALVEGIATEGLNILPWSKTTLQLRQRMAFMHALNPTAWPDVSDAALLKNLGDWLGPYLYGMSNRVDLARLNLADILLAMLGWEHRRELDECAPSHITVPSGRRIPLDYSDPAAPVLAVRLQEMFGLADTPRIGRGKVPVTLHLLSPAHRPVQITQDLAGFWRNTYFEVRKDLLGRYPKHYWPDDPLTAPATNRAKSRADGAGSR